MSSVEQIFKIPKEQYTDKKNPISDYITIASRVLQTVNNIENPIMKLKKYIKETKQFKNPKVKFHERDLNGVRKIRIDNLNNYVNYTKTSGDIIVPSFTVYFSKKKKASLHAEFIDVNVKERAMHKELALKYKMEENYVKASYHNVIQKVKKIFNNSLSGAYASMGTVLNNPSAHYTLTSITRSVTSIGNTIAESIISGNRHYRTPDITFNHIATIAAMLDMDKVKEAITVYNLHVPTAEEVMFSLMKSTVKYWRNLEKEQVILQYLESLQGYERVAILYHNDLFHIRKFNDKLVRDMINSMVNHPLNNHSKSECRQVLDGAPGWVLNLAIHIHSSKIKGKKAEDYSLDALQHMSSFILNLTEVLLKYDMLIKAFLITDIFPVSIAYVKDMVREAIVLSDTDSTCATYENWSTWFIGSCNIDDEAVSVAASVMTIVTQVTDHYIKTFAGNMNITNEAAQALAMKNEFFWDVFVNTNVSKHYFANIRIQEGNVFNHKDPLKSLEKKGVNLIAPNAYAPVRGMGEQIMIGIINDVTGNKQLSMDKYIEKVHDAEKLINEKIRNGSPDVLKMEKIKDAKAYKKIAKESPYMYYMLWEEVFSDKYGRAPDPQYMAVKVPTTINSKGDMVKFLDNIKDDTIQRKFRAFLSKINKDKITVFRLPLILVYNKGIPEELIDYIDYKRVIKDNVGSLHMTLESLGYYLKKDSILIDEIGDGLG